MKCSVKGCPGYYEQKRIVHTIKREDDVLVFDNVPADVCDVCSDTLLSPETVRGIEELVHHGRRPERQAPVYSYS